MPILPNASLLVRALYRVPVVTASSSRGLSTSAQQMAWTGSKPEDHTTQTSDAHNVQHDASEKGKEQRAKDGGSSATSERDSKNQNQRAKEEHPEAPGPVIGMNDERGGNGAKS